MTEEQVKIRKAPKYRSLVLTGIFIGIIVAAIVAYSFPSSLETAPLGQGISQSQAFGYLIVIFGVAGLAVASVVYLILDKISNRRIKDALAETEAVTAESENKEAADGNAASS